MKKYTITLMLTLSSLVAYPQMSVIPKAGLAITSADTEPEIGNQQSLQSILFGVGIEARVTSFFSIHPELLYVQKGAEYQVVVADTRRTINYIELPVMLN